MGSVREAIERVLAGHDPYPAVVVDRHWGMVSANARRGLLAGVAPHLLEPPVNVLRVSLHPEGLRPDREPRRVAGTPARAARPPGGDDRRPGARPLHEELAAYPGGEPPAVHDLDAGEIATPLRLIAGEDELAFISTITTFGTATDVTVSELSDRGVLPGRRGDGGLDPGVRGLWLKAGSGRTR